MMNVGDLHITGLLPLFDFANNRMSSGIIEKIFKSPLSSASEIKERQEILKGFVADGELLKSFSYSPVDLHDVFNFTTSEEGLIKYMPLFLMQKKNSSKKVRLFSFFSFFTNWRLNIYPG